MKKMRTLKSTIALILAVAMICAYLPTGVRAIEPTDWWTEDWSVNSSTLWNKVTENNEVVMQSLHSGDPVQMTYKQSIEHMDNITFDLRVDEFKADIGNAGIILYSDAGTEFFAYYNSGEHKVVLMDQVKVLDTPLVAGQWYTWNLHWDDTTITLTIDGQQMVSYNYSATGQTFTNTAKLTFSFWWHTSSVKNVSVYRDWDMSQWTVNLPEKATATTEGAANVLNLSHSEAPVTLSYNGSTVGMNTLDFDMRINEDNPGGGNAGVVLRPQTGGESFYNLFTAGNMFRLGDSYIGSPKTEISMGEYNHWRYQWDDTYLYIFINGTLQLQYDYTATGYDYDGAAILFSFWRHNVDLKNIYLSNSAVSNDWNYTLWESVGWTSATEDGVTVYSTSQGPHFLNYNGYLDGKNVFEADIRQNGGAANIGHVSMGIRTWDGQVRYFSYNPDTAVMRIFNEWDVLQDSVTLTTPLTEGSYHHWKVTWSNDILALSIDGNPVISYDYAAAGLDLSYGATCYVCEYFNPASAKNIVVGTEWDTTKWTPNGNWGTSVEDGCTVLSSLDLDGVLTLNYTGNLDGMNSFSADVRVNEIYDGFGNVGFAFQGTNGKRIFICYRAGAKSILIFNESDALLASAVLSEDMVKGEFVNWQFKWDDSAIKLYLDGVEAISFDYAAAGIDLTSGATLWLSRWRHGTSVKNLTLSNAKAAPTVNWTDSWTPGDGKMWYSMLHDGSYIVKSATADNDPPVAMTYNGVINGMKSVEMDIRFDRIKNSGGNVGLGIRTTTGAEYYLNYLCFDGVNAIIRKGDATIAEGVPALTAGSWNHWKLSWDESNIYLSIDDTVLATCAHNDDLAGATVFQSNWMYGTSIKDVVFTESDPASDWTDEWSGAGWTKSEEGGEPVMSAPNELYVLQYSGNLDGMNTFEADIRIDSIGVDFGNVSMGLSAANGVKRCFSYTHGTKTMRVFNENDVLIDSVEMEEQLTVGSYHHWEVQWNGENMMLYIDGKLIMYYDYAAVGMDLTSGATCWFSEWYHASTVKNVKLSNKQEDPLPGSDWTDEWSGAGWTKSEEGGEPVMSAPNELYVLQYSGNLDGMNTFEADIRIDSIGVDFGNVSMGLSAANGVKRCFSYTHGTKTMRVFNENDVLIDSVEMEEQLTVGSYHHWEVQWNGEYMMLYIDGKLVMYYDYAAVGMDLTSGATCWFSEWYHASTIKNVKLSSKQVEDPPSGEGWRPSGWTSADENGETVWTAQGAENAGNWPTMTYAGSLGNMNSLAFGMRYNATHWVEGWSGVTLTDGVNGAQYTIDYRADSNGVRIRRNDVYVVYTNLSFIPANNEWMDWQIMWSDTTLYLKINDMVVLQYNYSNQGDAFNARSRIGFS